MNKEPFSVRNRLSIIFITFVICLCGIYSIFTTPSSVFPETSFPRCVVLIDNGVMPANEMMAEITRPIEEAMKDIPGVVQVRSATGRGSAEVNVFFDWKSDMVQSELYVLNRIAQLKDALPKTCKTTVWRLTFNAFPILGVSLSSPIRSQTELWEILRYEIKPKFLRIPDVARVDIVGGRVPEYHVQVDPIKLASRNMSIEDVSESLINNNILDSAGFHMENYMMYLVLVDARAKNIEDIKNFVIASKDGKQIKISDIANVTLGEEPVFNVVNAQGKKAVLLNLRAKLQGSNILNIADNLKKEIDKLKEELPKDIEISFYYDQSLLVKESVGSVWESIIIGLLFAIIILWIFLKNFGSVITAITVIPVTLLVTTLGMKICGLTFNLMTLGGMAAAIGLIIDDAIVVVEAICTNVADGQSRKDAIKNAMAIIYKPLIGSTLMPVVVFLPLSFLDGVAGVFFRSLALTMVVALLTSLVLAVTLTPALASLLISKKELVAQKESKFVIMAFLESIFTKIIKLSLRIKWIVLAICILVLVGSWNLYKNMPSDFMPEMDESGFIIDYLTPWGTSIEETDRMMQEAESILLSIPEVEGYSRRTGARLALAIAEPNKGDFLVKLKQDRSRSTEDVKQELRKRLNDALPSIEWEFPGILGDLLGDLTESPDPIEIKIFSKDTKWLMKKAPEIKEAISKIDSVVDVSDGLHMTGASVVFKIKPIEAEHFGISSKYIANELNAALLGVNASTLLEDDRVVKIRVLSQKKNVSTIQDLKDLPLKTNDGKIIKLSQVASVEIDPGQLELRREDLRQLVAITAALENRDLGSAISEIKSVLLQDKEIKPGDFEIGGLFHQQEESFQNLMVVLMLSILLVFLLLIMQFRSFKEPIAIVIGSVLTISGALSALYITSVTLNIISFLGCIIGVGIVAKNGILMLDLVDYYLKKGHSIKEALIESGTRRLRPILMTSLSTVLAMLPLAWGIGHGADMLRPLAIAVIGELCISILFSLIVTPVIFYILSARKKCAQ